MNMRLNFVMGAKNGSTSRGQGNYQAVTVTLQLLNEPAFQKGPCPFAVELHNLPSRKTALSQNGRPGLQINQCNGEVVSSMWKAAVMESEGQATDFTPSSSCTF